MFGAKICPQIYSWALSVRQRLKLFFEPRSRKTVPCLKQSEDKYPSIFLGNWSLLFIYNPSNIFASARSVITSHVLKNFPAKTGQYPSDILNF